MVYKYIRWLGIGMLISLLFDSIPVSAACTCRLDLFRRDSSLTPSVKESAQQLKFDDTDTISWSTLRFYGEGRGIGVPFETSCLWHDSSGIRPIQMTNPHFNALILMN